MYISKHGQNFMKKKQVAPFPRVFQCSAWSTCYFVRT